MTTPANPPADLVTWLRRQLDEDERDIAPVAGWQHGPDRLTTMQGTTVLMSARRALAEVDAKRRILDAWEHALKYDGVVKFGGWESCIDMCPEAVLDNVVKLLAAPFAGRPGFREEWKPT